MKVITNLTIEGLEGDMISKRESIKGDSVGTNHENLIAGILEEFALNIRFSKPNEKLLKNCISKCGRREACDFSNLKPKKRIEEIFDWSMERRITSLFMMNYE